MPAEARAPIIDAATRWAQSPALASRPGNYPQIDVRIDWYGEHVACLGIMLRCRAKTLSPFGDRPEWRIVINADSPWYFGVDGRVGYDWARATWLMELEGVVLHEFGHVVLGPQHSTDARSIMTPDGLRWGESGIGKELRQ